MTTRFNHDARALFPGVSEIIDGTQGAIAEAGDVVAEVGELASTLSPLARQALDAIGALAEAMDRPDDVKRAAFVRRLNTRRASHLGAIARLERKPDTAQRAGRLVELRDLVRGSEEAIAYLRP